MKKETTKEEKLHVDCEPHDAEHCDINDHDNLDPSRDDCGHYVASGPQGRPLGPKHDDDQDPEHGPAFGIAGGPLHDGDQDPEHGPGVKK